MDNLLEIKNLNKTIGSLKLTDINLTLEPGYIMGLIGRNGAGKTSLIKTILRLYQKDSGEVFINGHSMDTQERRAKDDIGFVLDESPFEDNLTVETNGKSFGSLYSRYDHALFLKFCSRFEISPGRRPGNFPKDRRPGFSWPLHSPMMQSFS